VTEPLRAIAVLYGRTTQRLVVPWRHTGKALSSTNAVGIRLLGLKTFKVRRLKRMGTASLHHVLKREIRPATKDAAIRMLQLLINSRVALHDLFLGKRQERVICQKPLSLDVSYSREGPAGTNAALIFYGSYCPFVSPIKAIRQTLGFYIQILLSVMTRGAPWRHKDLLIRAAEEGTTFERNSSGDMSANLFKVKTTSSPPCFSSLSFCTKTLLLVNV
jgi:hypothetical protein